ncbi:AarF/UbiB family protein [Evansella sp. AB-P1]|uniref:ABC1 kinase family protein n=1 Tax=Evansella sp. AB-P1 TaxID=3037653 RepID=UPI00241E6517|nr:AarF/UbiB family protein [Evansella sp. AB-P1]MDG5785999.1 AarF/UbiB family protein [Evansella sp. AB-P1]
MKIKNKFIRTWKVLSMAFIIFIQVYWYKLRKKPDAEWDKLWEKIGRRFRNTLFELEGLLIKIGQLLSIRGDLLPERFIHQLQDLTDHVPPSQWNEIKAILEEEWGVSIVEKLKSIKKEAIASASIGEVYEGELKDGTKVAVKVQRPHIQSIVKTDFRTLSIIIWFADHFVPLPKGFINLKVLFKELKEVIERELDFSKELSSLLSFKERFSGSNIIKIPSAYEELTTEKVLVMEWVDGIRLTDRKALDQLEVSRKELCRRLMEVFLPQWLEPGVFHADPHTGNVLVSKEGEIILLDYGMVGEISKRDAIHFQKLIESILAKNYSNAVENLIHLGFLLPEADPRTMERLLAEFLSFQPSQLKEMDMIALKLEMNDIIQALPIQVPTRFVFLGRSFITIEGALQTLAPEEEMVDIVKPVFIDWLQEQDNSKWTFVWNWLQSQPLFKFFHNINEFLKTPAKLEQLKEVEQRRQFQFTIYENYKKHLFQLMYLGIIGIGVGVYLSISVIWQLASGVAAIGFVGYIICNSKLKKWMKYMHEKRRG